MFSFWDSVSDLRRIEFVSLLIVMIVPLVGGSVLLSVRQRMKTLQTRSTLSRGFAYEENVKKLESQKQHLAETLDRAEQERTALRRATAPRQLSSRQEDILQDKLRGVPASPVIVAAYAFEDESASYAAQIAGALRKAGWEATLTKASMNDFKGISLGTVNLTHRPLAGLHELAQAFTAAQLELRQRDIAADSIAGALQDGCLLVVVGRK